MLRPLAPFRSARPSLALAAVLAGAFALSGRPAQADLDVPTDFADERVFSGFDQSVGMAMLRDGRLFVVEKVTGHVRLLVNGVLAAVDPVVTVPEVDADILEEGLLGIAVDPGWPARPYIYVHYNHAGSPTIRISRFTVGGDVAFTGDGSLTADPASRYDILADIPDATPFHNSGTLRFGPDGMLFDSIGDDNIPCQAQDLTVLAGKILRLDVSRLPAGGGGPPPKSLITPADNPFVSHPNANARLVAHWGLRNPFRFAIDPLTGAMVIGDVGFETHEELNHVTGLGKNLQWPIYEGNVPGPGSCTGVDSTNWVDPVLVYDHEEGVAVVAGLIYRRPSSGSQSFPPQYEGDIFYNDFYSGWVRRVKRAGHMWVSASAPGQPTPFDWALDLGATVTTDWLVAPDGSIYYCRILGQYAQGPGEIRRLRYTGVVSVPVPAPAALAFRAYPSPARAEVQLDFALPAEGPVSLAIYDLGGRRVRELLSAERRGPGPQHATWDGQDASGRRAAAGVYLARLDAAGHRVERRLALLD